MKPDPITVPGAPIWVDLMTGDTAKSSEFYSELFGWKAQEGDANYGGYFMFDKDGVSTAGGMPKMDPAMCDVWSVYLNVSDARATLETAKQHGADVVADAMDVGTAGAMAVVSHPAAGIVGMWQPGDHHGFGETAVHGKPGWFELMTTDFAAAVDFYRDVFGWTVESVGDTDEFRYSVLQNGEEQYAGVMDALAFLPDGTPSHWSVYFAADDVDAASKEAERLGGSVMQPAMDTPYGRLAVISDATGAQFKLIGPNQAMPGPG